MSQSVSQQTSSALPALPRPAARFHERPTFTAIALFLLIFSGPPKLRLREPEASLRGDLDWVVMLHVAIWALAGLWVLLWLGKRIRARQSLLRLRLPQFLGLGMIFLLGASVWVSAAPALTAFKVYQMLVCMLFTQIFAERLGPRMSLKLVFWGSTLLCAVIAVCAFLAPDLVWGPSDFSWDPSRLKGDLIAPTGVVSAFAIILLVTGIRKARALATFLLCFFLGLLALSLMRTAYVVITVFFLLFLLRARNLKPLRPLAYLSGGLTLLLYAIHRLPSLTQYRNPDSISTLSDRLGLWSYLTDVTLNRSPWLGLGYYSASRIHGPEYNLGLGTAHSMFFEVFSGGGIPSFVLLVVLCLTLLLYASRLFWSGGRDRFTLAVCFLFIACLLFGSMGEEIDSGPVAVGFWFSAAALPILCERYAKRAPLSAFRLATAER